MVGLKRLVTKTVALYKEEVQTKIFKVETRRTGKYSIISIDEEADISAVTYQDPNEFYKRFRATYKGELVVWYQSIKQFLF